MFSVGCDGCRRGALVLAVLLALLALLLGGCGLSDPDAGSDQGGERAYSAATVSTTRVVAVGDIACPPGSVVTATTCRQAETAGLTQRLSPDLVLALGDLQYERGSLSNFQESYAKTWGALLPKTRPLPGNHEYKTAGASGYYSYFQSRQPGPPGYYRVTANGWNIYLLNSNCDRISCAREARWLQRQMEANPSQCSIVAMHHPRYSSGSAHGNSTAVTRFWKIAFRHRTDVALAGHDHDYERFTRMDPWGGVRPRRGIQSFVSGAGGKSLYKLGTRKHGSVYFKAGTPGVLELELRPGSYGWRFHGVNGTVLDSGTNSCL